MTSGMIRTSRMALFGTRIRIQSETCMKIIEQEQHLKSYMSDLNKQSFTQQLNASYKRHQIMIATETCKHSAPTIPNTDS